LFTIQEKKDLLKDSKSKEETNGEFEPFKQAVAILTSFNLLIDPPG